MRSHFPTTANILNLLVCPSEGTAAAEYFHALYICNVTASDVYHSKMTVHGFHLLQWNFCKLQEQAGLASLPVLIFKKFLVVTVIVSGAPVLFRS